MQGCLADVALAVDPSIKWVLDPYVGSGTTLGEAIRRGLCFVGQDVNPFAILLCKSKLVPFHHSSMKTAVDAVEARIKSDRAVNVSVSFPGRDKWFQLSVAQDLSRISRAIAAEADLDVRRFLWVALADTVRVTSNSRTSTYKLHKRSEEDIKTRVVQPTKAFSSVLSRNLDNLSEVAARLQKAGRLDSTFRCSATAKVVLGDTMSGVPTCPSLEGFDLLITSPPYGDNPTTVPYGQFSYLPLQWIPLVDIEPDTDPTCLSSTHEIDHRSIGGSLKGAVECLTPLKERAPAICELEKQLKGRPRDRLLRVAAYLRDIDKSLDPILGSLKAGALMFWTIGNRRVGGIQIPTDKILGELLESRGATLITKVSRDIPTKRMAVKNNVTSTMRREQILVLRKGGNDA